MYQFIIPKQERSVEKLWIQIQRSLAEKQFILSITDVVYELLLVSDEAISIIRKTDVVISLKSSKKKMLCQS